MKIKGFGFGFIEIGGATYPHDVVIERGRVSKRREKPSKPLRDRYEHTPLTLEAAIPWDCRRLVIGTGASRPGGRCAAAAATSRRRSGGSNGDGGPSRRLARRCILFATASPLRRRRSKPRRTSVMDVKTEQKAEEWSVQVRFEENGVRTAAHVTLVAGERRVKAHGSARRNPVDPDLPRVGEDLALARALSSLAHELVGDAIARLEEATGEPADVLAGEESIAW